MTYILIGSFIFIVLIVIVILRVYSKFQIINIKITEAENNIDILLEKKYDLLDRSRPIINKELKISTFLKELGQMKEKKLSPIDEHNWLKEYYNELFKTIDDHDKLTENEKLIAIIEPLNINEIDLIASIKFYNDNVTKLNQLVTTFPSNIIRLFFGIKKKDFFTHEKREIFEILKSE